MDSTVLAGVMGLVGAFIGGLATLIVGLLAVSAQKTRDAEAETTQVRATLQAIRDEVNELTQVHMASAGAIIDAASVAEPIALLYPVSAHYFTAFEANARSVWWQTMSCAVRSSGHMCTSRRFLTRSA